jgi:hypothetical protein
MNSSIALASKTETGRLGIMLLKRYWEKQMAIVSRKATTQLFADEWNIDKSLLSVLSVGEEQILRFLFMQNPTFEELEEWVLEINGGTFDADKIASFNKCLIEGDIPVTLSNDTENVLSADDLAFWDENGYIIVRNAVDKQDCEVAATAICEHIGVDLNNPATWYNGENKAGIMVQLWQHEALERNRRAKRVRDAFRQVWDREDVFVNTDRGGFNPPETERYKFQGSPLHWDVSLSQPIPFGTQGILYLTDTQANQGAFTAVPGFQHKVGQWLQNLPAGAKPRDENLYALGAQPIAANAGDLIIWHQALPHGASPNTSALPRIVQYLNYKPVMMDIHPVWL